VASKQVINALKKVIESNTAQGMTSTMDIPLGPLGSLTLTGSEGKSFDEQVERISTAKIKKDDLVFVSEDNDWSGFSPKLEDAAEEFSDAAYRFFNVLKKYGFIRIKTGFSD